MTLFRKLYLNPRFFWILSAVGIVYIVAFFIPLMLYIAHGLLFLLAVAGVLDILLLFLPKDALTAQRALPEKFSNGDENLVNITVKNLYPITIGLHIIDEVPFQFQERNFLLNATLSSRKSLTLQYALHPKSRGEYHFGGLQIFAHSALGLVAKRYTFQQGAVLPCYPSFIHLHRYELMALQNEFLLGGIRKIRRLGHTMEFEQIKEYVPGDDIRTINWKATSKRNQLMVNQYQEEKSQRIFMLIDKGRTMQMPFDGLSLLDYSINATMALSHIILKKGDRAGVLSFSRKAENTVPAEGGMKQLKKISDAFYNLQTDFAESDFGRLYQDTKRLISQRSLLVLFSNFETLDALNRQMKYLRGIAKNHLLVVVFFKNSELQKMMTSNPENIQEVYDGIIAEKFEMEKKLIIQELRKYGIYSVYTAPENLNIEVINQYLQIKARGIL